MAKSKQYKVVDPIGVVGFNGVIHKTDEVISSADVPTANLKAWLRFGQVKEVETAEEKPPAETAGKEKGRK